MIDYQVEAPAAAGRPPLVVEEYDDTPWTDDDLELLAWEAGMEAGWKDMDDYDHYPSNTGPAFPE